MRVIAIFLLLSSIAGPCLAGTPAVSVCKDSQSDEFGDWRTNYHGVVDGKAVGMTLTFHGQEITGQVFVAPDYLDQDVEGKVDPDGVVTLRARDAGGGVMDVFTGRFPDTKYCEHLTGNWAKSLGGLQDMAWTVSMTDANHTEAGANYYSSIGVSDDRQVDGPALALQKAVVAKDRQAVAALIGYPLTLTQGRKHIEVKDPKQFLALYDQIFTPYMVQDIAAAVPHHMFAKYQDALLTSTIWLDDHGRLHSIDVMLEPIACMLDRKFSKDAPPATTPGAKALEAGCAQYAGVDDPHLLKGDKYETAFVCDTPKHHILVDTRDDLHYRYRAWLKPHPESVKPDMEIDTGTSDAEGHDECAYTEWTFTKGDTTYRVSELGCTEEQPPAGSVGQLDILIHDGLKQTLWCAKPSRSDP